MGAPLGGPTQALTHNGFQKRESPIAIPGGAPGGPLHKELLQSTIVSTATHPLYREGHEGALTMEARRVAVQREDPPEEIPPSHEEADLS